MQKICKTAIFDFQEKDQGLIDELSKFLDENAKIALDFFEIEMPKDKVQINIIPSKEEFDNVFKSSRSLSKDYQVPSWLRGTCRDGVITYLSIHGYNGTTHAFDEKDYEKALEDYKKTILHEYVHFINENFNKQKNCSYTEKYLVEGIATYLSGQKEGQNLQLTASKEKILNPRNYYYNDYYLLTKYLVENYDKPFVLELFQSSRMAREFLTNELYDKTQGHFNKTPENSI